MFTPEKERVNDYIPKLCLKNILTSDFQNKSDTLSKICRVNSQVSKLQQNSIDKLERKLLGLTTVFD